jgi:hypothetical protein
MTKLFIGMFLTATAAMGQDAKVVAGYRALQVIL